MNKELPEKIEDIEGFYKETFLNKEVNTSDDLWCKIEKDLNISSSILNKMSDSLNKYFSKVFIYKTSMIVLSFIAVTSLFFFIFKKQSENAHINGNESKQTLSDTSIKVQKLKKEGLKVTIDKEPTKTKESTHSQILAKVSKPTHIHYKDSSNTEELNDFTMSEKPPSIKPDLKKDTITFTHTANEDKPKSFFEKKLKQQKDTTSTLFKIKK